MPHVFPRNIVCPLPTLRAEHGVVVYYEYEPIFKAAAAVNTR